MSTAFNNLGASNTDQEDVDEDDAGFDVEFRQRQEEELGGEFSTNSEEARAAVNALSQGQNVQRRPPPVDDDDDEERKSENKSS